jgi:polyisoprenoid-binding protein YceI
MLRRSVFVLAASLLTTLAAQADSAEWALDSSHSRFAFSVPHMMVSTVTGRFKQASGKVLLDEANLTKSQVELTIKADSVDTDEPKRDEHLRSPEFFDSKKFPNITFTSTKIVKGGAGYKVTGDLTIRDVKKSVTLDTTLSAPIKNPWGKQVRAAKVSGKLKRGDFGLKWNKALETGGVIVGDDVTLDIQLELNK